MIPIWTRSKRRPAATPTAAPSWLQQSVLEPLLRYRKLWLGAVFCLLLALAWRATPAQYPLRQVRVKGYFPHLDAITLQQTLAPWIPGGFFRLDQRGLQQALEALPWLAEVDLWRIWPDRLVLHIIEHQPVARWGRHGFLTAHGVRFYPPAGVLPSSAVDLPQLNAPESRAQDVLVMLQWLEERLRAIGHRVAALELTERLAWRLLLDDDTALVLGRGRPRKRFERWLRAYRRPHSPLRAAVGQRMIVDLRYSHGMAVHYEKRAIAPAVTSGKKWQNVQKKT